MQEEEEQESTARGSDEIMPDGARASDEVMSDEVLCQPCGEEAPVKVARDPGNPTTEEVDNHFVTHFPYRSWCPVCVMAKGKEEAHFRSKEKEKSKVPIIGIDYKVFGQEIETDDKATAIVMRERLRVHFWACLRA